MKTLVVLSLLLVLNSQAKEESRIKAVDVYEIKSFNLSSGGGIVESGDYKITSSIGQIDASDDLVSGDYKLQGGFLHQNRSTDVIFKNGFE